MGVKELVSKLRNVVAPSRAKIDPAADADDLAPLAEDRPPTLATGVNPAAGERRQGTTGSQADPAALVKRGAAFSVMQIAP